MIKEELEMRKFDYDKIESYYDKPYWDTPGVKSGYTNMTKSLGGVWHKQACSWFDSVIPVKGKTLLDAGCGLGHFMYGFADLGADVSGADSSTFCCDFLREHCTLPVYQTRLENLVMIAPDSVDIVFCTSTLEHIPREHIERVLLNLIRVAKSGGTIFLEVDTIPNDERDFAEESHVNIQPWDNWYEEFCKPVYNWVALPQVGVDLYTTTEFPGFPLDQWRFAVLRKL